MNLIKRYGLSTYNGTNVIAVLLAAMEFSRDFDEDTRKWLLPTLWTLMIVTFWLIRGNTAPEVADELNTIGKEDIRDVLKEGRE